VDALTTIRTRNAVTPQSEQAETRQVPNNAGGWPFQIGDKQRVLRFLILGTDGGTYYVSERDLTKDNATVILRMAETDGVELVKLILDVSQAGRAPKQNPTLFALAACAASSDSLTRQAAFKAIPLVCRTGTMLFIFARYVEQFRGWGRGLRKAMGDWYLTPSVDQVAFQSVKYRQREGWSHRDLLRLAHPKPGLEERSRRELFDWICRGTGTDIPIVEGYRKAQEATTAGHWAALITG
jgi:60 kDa SS-A/Ro ribonucleoprotein